ncbi:cache domain-containing protein [Uliginosibacterium gangwonense]|uniref:cache domain-containing protein n=1 Tax=Uliginosibacterium gangwonense TaxID=392736 RepID=UPI00037CA269|nr:cache domain-containing protein [Uliginosibacterium gangwonense]
MKTFTVLFACLLLNATAVFAADEFATAKDAEAMVKKAVAALKTNREATLGEITAKDAKWINRDLYPVVVDMTAKILAHGQNPKMVGKELIDFKDPDGKAFYKERIDLANSKGKFWQDYKFTDPITKKVLPKQAYCEKAGDVVVCAGIYKR